MIIKYLNSFKVTEILCVVLLIATLSCARVSSPDGGPEDKQPPTLLKSIPENEQINYRGQVIFLEFDELVTTDQIETNLIITPKPSSSFRTRNSRTSIQLEFFEPFEDSTTYTFSFANSIKDLTDGNAATGLTLSFSTGDYLDSLSVTGQIRNLYDLIPEEDILVSLYPASDSLNILNGPASYYTKTDSIGNYVFKNLPPNLYRVYAVKDKNKNNKADSDSEMYGFYSDTISVFQNVENIDFTIQRLSTKNLRLISGRHFGRYYELNFNKSITSFELINQQDALYHQTAKDIVRFYRTNENFNDTTELIFQAQDSLGTILTDTANFYFVESDIEPDKLTATLAPKRTLFKPQEELALQFNKPVNLFLEDSIEVFVDTLNIFPISNTLLQSNFNQTKYKLPFTIGNYIQRPDQRASIRFKTGVFLSIDSDTSDIISKTVQIALEDETALISGTVISGSQNVIVQLLNAQNLEVIEETTDLNFTFNFLKAGTYMLRAIDDSNGNGKWDTGNILKNENPERAAIWYDPDFDTQLIEVRKNWASTELVINLR